MRSSSSGTLTEPPPTHPANGRLRKTFRNFWRSLSTNSAQTSINAEDARLRGRTYNVPFARVWDETLDLIRTSPRWTLVNANEGRGSIWAEASSLVFKLTGDVRIRISLDENALTRVDLRSSSRVGKSDLGTNARRISWFLRRLDRRLGYRR